LKFVEKIHLFFETRQRLAIFINREEVLRVHNIALGKAKAHQIQQKPTLSILHFSNKIP
jgi:hypothetical protein